MDDTWVESPTQTKQDKDHVVEDNQSDSDADSDIIPQFDGPGDEKSTSKSSCSINSYLTQYHAIVSVNNPEKESSSSTV